MKKIYIILILISSFGFSQSGTIDPLKTTGSFMPVVGKKYIVSCWVNEDVASNNYFASELILGFDTNAITFKPSGQIIDGWQRIVGIFDVPADATFIDLQLSNTSGKTTYFDDVRFYPYNGNIKSFVYAEDTQRLMAELDENNYATFYEYDLEGGLIRVKKETERGVMTIQETRSNTIKR